jgi:hypothetical protein
MLLLTRELCIVKRKLAGEHTDNKRYREEEIYDRRFFNFFWVFCDLSD